MNPDERSATGITMLNVPISDATLAALVAASARRGISLLRLAREALEQASTAPAPGEQRTPGILRLGDGAQTNAD